MTLWPQNKLINPTYPAEEGSARQQLFIYKQRVKATKQHSSQDVRVHMRSTFPFRRVWSTTVNRPKENHQRQEGGAQTSIVLSASCTMSDKKRMFSPTRVKVARASLNVVGIYSIDTKPLDVGAVTDEG